MKRATVILLILATLASFFACSGGNEVPVSAADSETSAAEGSEAAEETTVAGRPALNLPVRDYEGASFTIISYPKGDSGTWHQFSEFGTDQESTGDLINDAVYSRNMAVESRFNVSIGNIENKNVADTVKSASLAGDNEFDIALAYIDESLKLAQSGLLNDFKKLDMLDLSAEWWEQSIISDLGIGKKTYVLSGDILISSEELLNFVGFNKQLFRDYKIDDPYTAVIDGLWTLDMLSDISKKITNDADGDGQLTGNDVYGAAHDHSIAYYVFSSTGEKVASLDSSGKPELTINTTTALNAIEKIGKIYSDPQTMLMITSLKGSWTESREMFVDNRIAMLVSSMYVLQSRRNMISDFGILPIPKYDENQKNYYHTPATHVTQCLSMPIINTDFEKTGLILEALAYESEATLVKAYYDYNLQTKISRDEESGDMLDIIFGSIFYDVGLVFGWGGMKDIIIKSIKNPGSFASLFTAAETKAQTELEASYELFK